LLDRRTILSEGQERYIISAIASVPTGGSYTLNITIDKGWKFNLSCLTVTCEASCIQYFELIWQDQIVLRTWFDIEKTINFPESGAYVINYGETLKLIIYNLDEVSRYMSINLSGTLEKVE